MANWNPFQAASANMSYAAAVRSTSENDDENKSSSPVEEFMFYGIYVPPDDTTVCLKDVVVKSKAEALKAVKLNRRARFKGFSSLEEASEFSKSGGEISICSNGIPTTPGSEQPSYKSVIPQDLVLFRKAVECNDLFKIQRMISENPRYLVGSGDTPTILQEGCRYNALHIAARNNATHVLDYILTVISDMEFITKLYGPNGSNNEERRNVMLDLYLNMPEKGLNETPLHFASKLGHVEIVKSLISYPQCDKQSRNKVGQTAAEIACSRAPRDLWGCKPEIVKLLATQYFVPVLRAVDNSLPPVIGEPFTSRDPPTPLRTCMTPPLEVRALAGPMSKDQAKVFRKKWKTPPRNLSFSGDPRPELTDPEKGLEKVGRSLANEFSVSWREYWPFLNAYLDIASPEGLQALECYLKEKFDEIYSREETYNSCSCTNPCTSLYCQQRPLPPEPRRKFVDNPFDLPSILSLEMSRLHISEPEPTNKDENQMEESYYLHSREKQDFIQSSLIASRVLRTVNKPPVPTDVMEKCCQRFASRLSYAIIKDKRLRIMKEISKFQLFLAGCSTDDQFYGIDFRKSHFRLATMVSLKIITITSDLSFIIDKMNGIIKVKPEYRIIHCKLDSENLVGAGICIVGKCIDLLQSYLYKKWTGKIPIDIEEMNMEWAITPACLCSPPVIKSSSRPETSLSSYSSNRYEDQTEECFTEDDDSEDASSDLDSDFYTAPNSPVVVAEDEADMQLCETGPDIFLTGGCPTNVDLSVYEALNGISIPLDGFPHITLWRHTCQEYFIKAAFRRPVRRHLQFETSREGEESRSPVQRSLNFDN